MLGNPFDRIVKKYKVRIENLEERVHRLEKRSDSYSGGETAQKALLNVMAKIRPYSAKGFSKIRVGSANDGGYVLIDDLAAIKTCISCGISDNDEFDLDLAQQNVAVLQFDHTIDAAPSKHSNLQFFKKKIVASPNEDGQTLSSLLQGAEPGSVLLKCDIEGDEWPVFDALPEQDLHAFRQIVCEFHGCLQFAQQSALSRAGRILRKIADKFFVCHVHANNCGEYGFVGEIAIPDVIELTFANRRYYEPIDNKPIFPTELDAPNHVSRLDYRLGCFWF